MSIDVQLLLDRKGFALDIDTRISSTGVTAIYGHSGAGKTTLLRWLAGLENSHSGVLQFNDQSWQTAQHCLPTQQRQIGFVFQDGRLFPHLDVLSNLHYAHQRRFNDNGPTMAQVTDWLQLDALLTKNIGELSGGETQRVAIARALLSSPQLLLMDEPLASLDQHSKQSILQHLENLQQQLSIPVIYVSHSIEEVCRVADHLILLEKGHIAGHGPLLEMVTRLDLSISHEEKAASILAAPIAQQDQQYQLTQLALNEELQLALTHIDGEIGDQVRVLIPARDVSIALEKSECSSIQNILPATIEAIETSNGSRSLLRLNIAGQQLLARLTQKSVEQLQLQSGQAVFAQIKTVALLSAGVSQTTANNK